MSDDWSGWTSTLFVPVTAEALADAGTLSAAIDEMIAAELDARLDGPQLGPGRRELWVIERPQRVRDNIRFNVTGRPAGRFMREPRR